MSEQRVKNTTTTQLQLSQRYFLLSSKFSSPKTVTEKLITVPKIEFATPYMDHAWWVSISEAHFWRRLPSPDKAIDYLLHWVVVKEFGYDVRTKPTHKHTQVPFKNTSKNIDEIDKTI